VLTILQVRLMRDWNSPIYAFFKPTPAIEYIQGRRLHVFECTTISCKGKGNGCLVQQYFDTGDAKSTSNLRKHAKLCWGEDTVTAADQTGGVAAARDILLKTKGRDGSITAAFERVGKGKVSYSHRQHTRTEAW